MNERPFAYRGDCNKDIPIGASKGGYCVHVHTASLVCCFRHLSRVHSRIFFSPGCQCPLARHVTALLVEGMSAARCTHHSAGRNMLESNAHHSGIHTALYGVWLGGGATFSSTTTFTASQPKNTSKVLFFLT